MILMPRLQFSFNTLARVSVEITGTSQARRTLRGKRSRNSSAPQNASKRWLPARKGQSGLSRRRENSSTVSEGFLPEPSQVPGTCFWRQGRSLRRILQPRGALSVHPLWRSAASVRASEICAASRQCGHPVEAGASTPTPGILTTMDAQNLAVLAANAWAAQHGCPPLLYERPDELSRRDRAVDLLGRDPEGRPRLVLEHTLVESFLDQRSKQIAAIAMFKPLERQLSGQMPAPGHHNLALKPGTVLGLKREVRRIREWVAEWIRATAPSLAIGGARGGPQPLAPPAPPLPSPAVSAFPSR